MVVLVCQMPQATICLCVCERERELGSIGVGLSTRVGGEGMPL